MAFSVCNIFGNIMNFRHFFLAIALTAFISCSITAIAYKPLARAIYKIREPYFIYPIKAVSNRLTIRNDSHGDGQFGAERRNGRTHAGIDFQAPIGAEVYAARSGIAFRGNVPTGYGKYIMIYHPDGYQTMYAHLSNWAVSSTQEVHRGDLIGFVGKTGNAANSSIQPHLHFEIRLNGEPVDPRNITR